MDLLKAIFDVPEIQGSITLWKPKGGTKFVTLDQLHNYERQEDWYFHIPTHNQNLIPAGKRGSKKSATNFTALWVDFDMAWKDPKYATDEEFKLLIEHLARSNVAPSGIVNSGGGYHLYWLLDRAYGCQEFMSACKSWNKFVLAEANKVAGRDIDIDQLGDMARILRLPGTINKGKLVQTVALNPNLRYELNSLLQLTDYNTITERGTGKAAVTNRLLQAMGVTGVQIPSYTRNLIKTCGQVRNFFKVGGDVSEPLWYSFAGLLPYTDDGLDYFINLSENVAHAKDSDRSASGALAKIEQWKSASDGPATCQRFHDHEPSICKACPHFKNPKIKSPLQVGRDEVTVAIQPQLEIEQPFTEFQIVERLDHTSFTPPEPFKIDEHGQVITMVKNDLGIPEAKIITHNTLVPRKTTWAEAEKKGILHFDVHTKHNGIKTVEVSMGDLAGANSPAIRLLMEANLLVAHGQNALLAGYLAKCNQYMQELSKVNNTYARMGWRSQNIEEDNASLDDRFVLGGLTFYINGESVVEGVDASLDNTAKTLKMKGDLDEWKQAISYFAHPALKRHQLVFLGGFAVPLLRAGQILGLTVNLLSRDSGSLKSFTMRALTSIYGEPDERKLTAEDSVNAMTAKISTHCDIPVTYDEITNIETDDLGKLLYMMSSGKRGDRMTQTSQLRENPFIWRTVLFTSSNSSLDDKLNSWSTPERMRLLEIPIDAKLTRELKPSDNSRVMETLNKNHGTAGVKWIHYLAHNRDKVFRDVELMTNHLMQKAGNNDSSKRFWVAFAACTLVAAEHTRQLGLHSFDMGSLYETVMDIIGSSTTKIDSDEQPLPMYLHDFMIEALDKTQSVKYTGVKANDPLPVNKGEILREARGEVHVLINLREAIGMGVKRTAFVSRMALKKYLSLNRISFKDMVDDLQRQNILISKSARPRVKIDSKENVVQMYAIEVDLDKLNALTETNGDTVSRQDTVIGA